jgi:membrane-associated phospholipid phosphatase
MITHLGAVGIALPMLAFTAIGLWQSHQRASVRIWLMAIALAVTVTVASKVLFNGWGLGIASLNFTGISGHTVLATSVLPMFFCWLGASDRPRFRLAGVIFGLILSVVVGVSRVVLGAHSGSEVVSAWLVGAAVSWVGFSALEGSIQPLRLSRLVPLILLLVLGTTTSSYFPTHDWEVKLSLFLSGRDKPYTRQQLLSRQVQANSVFFTSHPPLPMA